MPTITIETERLTFIPLSDNDAQLIVDLKGNKQVIQYTNESFITSIVDAQTFIKHSIEQSSSKTWSLELKKSGEKVGVINLKDCDTDNMADIGYQFLPAFWGKGLASEAVKKCMEVGFETFQLDKIIAFVDKQNVSSIAVLEKNNFRKSKEGNECGAPTFTFEALK